MDECLPNMVLIAFCTQIRRYYITYNVDIIRCVLPVSECVCDYMWPV